jgi:hypothetical protein
MNLEPNGAYALDYADLLLRARANLRGFEDAMNKRHFGEAHEYMMNAFVDVRLLTHISGEACDNKQE